MAITYNCGSKAQAVRTMADCAIRDQKTLIEALTPKYGKPDADTQNAIDDCWRCIEDFKRIARVHAPEQ
jgi:hypothetical protein